MGTSNRLIFLSQAHKKSFSQTLLGKPNHKFLAIFPMTLKPSNASARPQSASPAMADRTRAIRRLTAFYVASLSAIAGLSLLGQWLIQNALKQQELDIQVISEAQQQKMLVPQMMRTTMLIQMSSDTTTRAQYQEELEKAIASANSWQRTMGTLAQDGRLSSARRQQIQQMVNQLAPTQEQLVSLAQRAITGQGGPGQPGEAGSSGTPGQPPGMPPFPGQRLQPPGQRQWPLGRRSQPPGQGQPPFGQTARPAHPMELERRFMRELDELILTYNQQVVASTQYLKRLELGLLVVTLLVLILEGVLVFRPAVNKIRETMGALADSLQKTQAMAKRLEQEKKKSEKLLLNILPQPVAHRLREKQQAIADGFAEVSVLFADIVGFTKLSTTMPPRQLVDLLNQIFSSFDELAERHGLEKIKTIGDAYMVVGGLPVPRADHAEAIVAMAIDMQRAIVTFNQQNNQSFQIRIGINSGPVVAGVIGIKKFIYDLWGDTVNTASRMETHGVPGGIHITDSTYQRIKHKYHAESQGLIQVKGKGEMETYLIVGAKGEARGTAARTQRV